MHRHAFGDVFPIPFVVEARWHRCPLVLAMSCTAFIIQWNGVFAIPVIALRSDRVSLSSKDGLHLCNLFLLRFDDLLAQGGDLWIRNRRLLAHKNGARVVWNHRA